MNTDDYKMILGYKILKIFNRISIIILFIKSGLNS